MEVVRSIADPIVSGISFTVDTPGRVFRKERGRVFRKERKSLQEGEKENRKEEKETEEDRGGIYPRPST